MVVREVWVRVGGIGVGMEGDVPLSQVGEPERID